MYEVKNRRKVRWGEEKWKGKVSGEVEVQVSLYFTVVSTSPLPFFPSFISRNACRDISMWGTEECLARKEPIRERKEEESPEHDHEQKPT